MDPNCILSDNGTQFASHIWKNKLANMKISVTFSPVRHPQGNPNESYMRVTTAMRHIKDGQNCYLTVKAGSKKCSQIQLTTALLSWYSIALEFLQKGSEQKPAAESLQEKALKAYLRTKEKAAKRSKRRKTCSFKWESQVGDLLPTKCQAVSEAVDGITKTSWWALESDASDKLTYIWAIETCWAANTTKRHLSWSIIKLYMTVCKTAIYEESVIVHIYNND